MKGLTGSTDGDNSGKIELTLLRFTLSFAVNRILPSKAADLAYHHPRGHRDRTDLSGLNLVSDLDWNRSR